MTAPFFLVESIDISADGVIVVEGAEGRHAVSVRRLTVDEPVLVGNGSGLVASGVVSAASGRDRLEVRVLEVVEHPAPSPQLIVVQALAKGDRGELSVELLTEVGVDSIVPWAASRSIAQWRGEKAERGVLKWQSTAREAAKQSRRAFLPEVRALASTRDVVALIAEVVASGGIALVLHEQAIRRIRSDLLEPVSTVLLVVGPEGGISDDEKASFEQAGAVAVHLGPTVLRTSTAGVVASAIVLAATPRWDG